MRVSAWFRSILQQEILSHAQASAYVCVNLEQIFAQSSATRQVRNFTLFTFLFIVIRTSVPAARVPLFCSYHILTSSVIYFCRALQCNFCRKCKLEAISCAIWVRHLLWFSKNRRQVASDFEHVWNLCDIARQIASKWHWIRRPFTLAIWRCSLRATKIASKGATKIAQKIACVHL